MFLKSLYSKFKSKRTSKKEQRKMLKGVEREAYLKERNLVKQEKKAKEADRFLKQIEAAKKKGAAKARINGKTISIKSAVSKARTAKRIANVAYKDAKLAYRYTDKVLTRMVESEFLGAARYSEPGKKPRSAKPQKQVGRVQSKKPPQKQVAPIKSRKYNKYIITHTPSGKTRTVHALGYNEAKDMAKQLFGINSTKKLVATQR